MAFGWPPVIVAVGLTIAGMLRKRPTYLFVAAAIVLPFGAYLAATPGFAWGGLLVPLSLAAAALAQKYQRAALAWVLLIPFAAMTTWIAIIVLND
jgi:hypothetical protein